MSGQPPDQKYAWTVQPAAAALIARYLQRFRSRLPELEVLSRRMAEETGTRLVDWIDHFTIEHDSGEEQALIEAGYTRPPTATAGGVDVIGELSVWTHEDGIFPAIGLTDKQTPTVAIRVDSVSDFLFAHRLSVAIEGAAGSTVRMAEVSRGEQARLCVIERRGNRAFSPADAPWYSSDVVLEQYEAFRLRRRRFSDPGDGIAHAVTLAESAVGLLGVDVACELFFAAEREYWQSRNRAARVQKSRQDQLGLGWANHDHHTYRSSRVHFQSLIDLLEKLGMQCRERFYGGREAGWGAQVLEHPVTGVVVFADVDLSPEEVMGDFAHEGLAANEQVGTVGLWCCLHGEAILQAGMHHLECQFDFDRARRQLAETGIESMTPFTDLPELKQAFTKPEIWPVDAVRIEAAVAAGHLTDDQAKRFAAEGCWGSHLEILERNDGYRGFNQSGISEIIRKTDPRVGSER